MKWKTISFINEISSECEQTTTDLADLTLDDFKTCTPVNLKAFIHLRGKNSKGG